MHLSTLHYNADRCRPEEMRPSCLASAKSVIFICRFQGKLSPDYLARRLCVIFGKYWPKLLVNTFKIVMCTFVYSILSMQQLKKKLTHRINWPLDCKFLNFRKTQIFNSFPTAHKMTPLICKWLIWVQMFWYFCQPWIHPDKTFSRWHEILLFLFVIGDFGWIRTQVHIFICWRWWHATTLWCNTSHHSLGESHWVWCCHLQKNLRHNYFRVCYRREVTNFLKTTLYSCNRGYNDMLALNYKLLIVKTLLVKNKLEHIYSRLLSHSTARGSDSGLYLGGPTKGKARKSFLFTKGWLKVENDITCLRMRRLWPK